MQNSAPRLLQVASALGVLSFGQPAFGQAADDRFWLQASAYMPDIDSSLRVESNANPDVATQIDLESDLGLDDSETLPAFLVGARLGRNFTVTGEYFRIGRDATRTLDRSITFEGVTYPLAASVTSGFDTDVYRLVIGYSFVRNDRVEVGAALGLHATNFEVSVEGMGSVGGAAAQTEQRRQDFLAPLPTLGLFASFEVMPGLTIGGRADYLSLSIGDYDGRLLNAQATLKYRFTRNLGIGLAYRHVDYRVDVEKERFEGRFEYEFSGPAVFVELGF